MINAKARRDFNDVLDGMMQAVQHYHLQAIIGIDGANGEAKIAIVSRFVDHPDYYRVVVNPDKNRIDFFIGTTFYEDFTKRNLVWGELPDWGYDPESNETPYCTGYYSMKNFLSEYEGVDDTPVSCW